MKKPDLSFLTEEQKLNLTRDYYQNPLKRGELINEKDLRYLYLDLDMSDKELMEFFQKSKFYIQKCRCQYKIYKTKEQVLNKRYKTNREKYGGISPFCDEKVKQKSKETILERYGVENAFQNKEIQDKFKNTSLNKYGTDHPFQNKDIQNKYKETSKRNTGCEWGLSSTEIRQKAKQTCLDKYGVENCMQVLNNNNLSTQGEQLKQQLLDNIPNIVKKGEETKRKNNSFNTSTQELSVFEKLKLKFNDVKCQYKDDRYPYNCDFYIPDIDLFIELNFHWTHGQKPYNEKEDKK